MDNKYEGLWRQNNIMAKAFPNLPRKDRKRKTVSKKINKIRNIRNRIYHYEPIWHYHDLNEHKNAIFDIISWMSLEVCSFTKKIIE